MKKSNPRTLFTVLLILTVLTVTAVGAKASLALALLAVAGLLLGTPFPGFRLHTLLRMIPSPDLAPVCVRVPVVAPVTRRELMAREPW